MTTTTIFWIIYITGYVAGYYMFRFTVKKNGHSWVIKDALFGSFVSLLSWIWFLASLIGYLANHKSDFLNRKPPKFL